MNSLSSRSAVVRCGRESIRIKNATAYYPAVEKPPPEAKPPDMTLSEAVEGWLERCAGRYKRSTCSTYRRVAEKHVLGELGEIPVSELTNGEIYEFLQRKIYGARDAPPLASSTVSSIVTVLSGAVGYAECRGVRFYAWDALSRPRKTVCETQTLTQAEQNALKSTLFQDLRPNNFGILLCLYTGLRIGELCGLKWGDISDTGVLTVRRTAQRIQNPNYGEGDERHTVVVFDVPKSRCSQRSIPVPPVLLDKVDRLRRAPDCFVLTGDPDLFEEPRVVQRYFKRVLQQAGVRDVNFHALRHTFATNCVQVGCDPKTLSQMLGHADVAVTLNTYVHPSMSAMRDIMLRLCKDETW
ncbi:MAG: site-specific integrase [Oscillospiraceae bacterium]|nr:site-specific integrase [Oscillospiraceae bacterium]